MLHGLYIIKYHNAEVVKRVEMFRIYTSIINCGVVISEDIFMICY